MQNLLLCRPELPKIPHPSDPRWTTCLDREPQINDYPIWVFDGGPTPRDFAFTYEAAEMPGRGVMWRWNAVTKWVPVSALQHKAVPPDLIPMVVVERENLSARGFE